MVNGNFFEVKLENGGVFSYDGVRAGSCESGLGVSYITCYYPWMIYPLAQAWWSDLFLEEIGVKIFG